MSIPERHQEAYDAWVAAQKPPRLQKHQNETVWVPCYHERWNKYFDYRFTFSQLEVETGMTDNPESLGPMSEHMRQRESTDPYGLKTLAGLISEGRALDAVHVVRQLMNAAEYIAITEKIRVGLERRIGEQDKPVFKATAEDISPDSQSHNMDELKWLRADLGGDGLVFSEAVVRRAIAYIKELEHRLLGLEK